MNNKRHQKNYTLQNFYRLRNFIKFAEEIDDFFNLPIRNGNSLKEAIKEWVDKYIVHCDFTLDSDELEAISSLNILIDRTTLDNIFVHILLIARSYDDFRENFGKNLEEQMHLTLQWLTADPEPEAG